MLLLNKLLFRTLKRIKFEENVNFRNSSSICGVYIHWPYCRQKCTFCNFNKYVSDEVDHQRMIECLVREAKMMAKRSDPKQAGSIFFGGGTPSLMKVRNMATVIEAVKDIYNSPEDVEVSMEANPEDLVGKVKDFVEAGINRISVGVQGLNDQELKLLNRSHTTEQGMKALTESLSHLPNSTSADLMFGRPRQSLDDWLRELDSVLSTGVQHLSLYQLTVERGTKLEKQVKSGAVVLPVEEEVVDMYCEAVARMEGEGLKRYEVSNFAVEGRECRHNQLYWRGGEYAGVGPGAHSRLVVEGTRQAWVNVPLPERWMDKVEKEGIGVGRVQCQDVSEALKELLATGLRTREGVCRKDWDRLARGEVSLEAFVVGQDWREGVCRKDWDRLARGEVSMEAFVVGQDWRETGLVWDGDRLKLRRDKVNLVDNIVPYLFNRLDSRLSR